MTAMIVAMAVLMAWVLAFVGAPLWLWTLGAAVALGALALAAAWAPPLLLGLALLFVAAAAVLNVVPLRRALISRGAFAFFKRVLPEMSSTEREVLEAGDVWFEAELFRGRPDWQKLLSFQYTRLTTEERRFLDRECEELCKLCDDWKIEYEQKDLPREAWEYIARHKFFSMLIKKEFGGLGFSAAAQSGACDHGNKSM